jgi:hypothetical protein
MNQLTNYFMSFDRRKPRYQNDNPIGQNDRMVLTCFVIIIGKLVLQILL